MGMAMTILSLSMLARFVMPVRQLRPADLRPSEVWAALDDARQRTWARTVKFYENLKFVYQIQTTLQEWQQQDEEQQPAGRTENRRAQAAGQSSCAGTRSPLPSRRGMTLRDNVMNCQNHPEVPATAYCRSCGKAGVRRMPP